MSTYLVTGAAGFIGSAITHALVARGETVRGLDDLSSGFVQNLADIRNKIELTVGDVRDKALLGLLCEGVDTIFHQAAIASVQQSIEDPLGTWDVNVEGTRRLIEEARKAGVRRIVFASSSAIYGDSPSQPVAEDNSPSPLSPYANQKLACELLLQQAEEESAVQTVCLRYFNVFGPRQSASSPYSGAIARFFHCMTRPGPQSPVTIFGDGTNTRDFVFVEDVVAANLAAADACGSVVSGKSFNIGSGQAYSVSEVAHTIASISSFTGPFCNEAGRPGEVRHSVADIRQAQRLLGYKPTTALKEGLRAIHTWLGSRPMRAAITRVPARTVSILPRRRTAVSTVSHAIQNQEFSLAYQPIVALPSGKPIGVEALLRHKFEDRNRAPLRIIRQAEATGTDIELGTWALTAACEDAVKFQAAFSPDFRMSVNASMAQLEDPQFVEIVSQVLEASGISARTLEIEITERVLLSQAKIARHNLRALQEMGISVALDDFGCGQANLQHLCKLKVNRLKTDRSILRASSRGWPIFRGLVVFAQQLNIPLVAEGIETRSQLEKVLRAGCKEAQGYLFSRPSTLESLLPYAESKREVA
jgi:UDP-glucose 4-epimerase